MMLCPILLATPVATKAVYASVGTDPQNYTPRLIFGMWDLYDGLPLASVAIGTLAIAEILRRMAESNGQTKSAMQIRDTGDPDDSRVIWAEYWSCKHRVA